MLLQCCTQYTSKLGNSAVVTGLEKVSFHSNPKERQCQRMLKHDCMFLERGNLDTETCKQQRMPCEHESEIKAIHLQVKEQKRLPEKHKKLGEKHETFSPSQLLEGTNLTNVLISDF